MEARRTETASDHTLRKVPVYTPDKTVGEVLRAVRAGKWESADHIFVVNDWKTEKLLGFVPMRVVLSSPDDLKISVIMRTDFPAVGAGMHEENVAIIAIQQKLDMIPVVEKDRFFGAIDAADLLRILHESHAGRLLHRSGILRDARIVDIFKARIFTLVRLRLPWLLVGIAGGMLATILVSRFSGTLERAVQLAFFIPVVTYMTDAVGTQTVALLVRGFTLEKFKIWNYLVKEFSVGLLMGAVLGFLIFIFALTAFGSWPVAKTVGISMFLGVSFSTLIAGLVTYLLRFLGKDPGVAADPLVTVLQDIISVLIYFTVASFLVF